MNDLTGLGKVAESVDSVTKELRQLIYEFLSPGTKGAGEYIADKVRYLRFMNSVRAMQKAKVILESMGVDNVHIELRNLVPLIEKCSLEEDDTLIDKWANLIASAVVDKSFSPSYISILSSLSPIESLVLDTISRNSRPIMKMGIYQYYGVELHILVDKSNCVRADLVGVLSNLERLGLILRVFENEPALMFGNPPIGTMQSELIGLTPLGGRFILACDRKLEVGNGIPHIDLSILSTEVI
ncbi:hypothetical protein DP73_04885 [Desulfosporosinus sp. HMP52]|uniref:Abi-alpha family protein n=1 Tax=Desulfosporosinus sp. HMP52 TaxID=1487923 RepID=UPI00051FDFF4|nr:Abi-alpha family protein [Desulfosporosinus sp. HMP52]KGK91176.1 hypothetical protein DP73_04885 [Desulfosporosinus sp. HMP52]